MRGAVALAAWLVTRNVLTAGPPMAAWEWGFTLALAAGFALRAAWPDLRRPAGRGPSHVTDVPRNRE